MISYADFIERKSQLGSMDGFKPIFMPGFLFPFQASLTEWSIRKGRSALFEDCGLGKTPQQLVWAENVVRHTNGTVLICAPLAVSGQTAKEGEKFGIEVHRSNDGRLRKGINVTNYEKLHLFNHQEVDGMCCDESSILKNFDGARKLEITNFMRKIKYRLLCTATASPNDYPELGTSSEAVGDLGYMDMLSRFFRNDQNTCKPVVYRHRGQNFAVLDEGAKWKLKKHAESAFWQWVCSWARAIRKPSDMGFEDGGFILPPLTQQEHLVESKSLPSGMLFDLPAIGLEQQNEERRRTITERCEKAAALVYGTNKTAVVWCHLNPEGDLLENLIPDSKQVAGKHSDGKKEEILTAFSSGELRVLIIKPKIGAWGLNWQHCAHQVYFPSHSFEQFYQGIRRCWRFGQKNPVNIDIVTTGGGLGILKNLQRKSNAADHMFSQLVSLMHEAKGINRDDRFINKEEVPVWL